jgi:hypothetical protein
MPKSFSNSINGGLTVRVINQNIQNLSATGVAFDAGVSYTTRFGSKDKPKNKDNLQFGIALKNVGPPMKLVVMVWVLEVQFLAVTAV